MGFRTVLIGVGLSALAASAYVAIADDTTPADPTAKEPKLISPYNLLTNLSADQVAKIEDIHKQELDAEKVLKQKETTDIEAVLTTQQKKELADASTKVAAEKKAAAEALRAKIAAEKAKALKDKADQMGTPTSQPAGNGGM